MRMEKNALYRYVDHTALKPYVTLEEIRQLCREAVAHNMASVCIPSCYIKEVRREFPELVVCTVVGFPLGYANTASKIAETKQALEDGADEIDMVINLTDVKNRRYPAVEEEVRSIKQVVGEHVLKVIIETCYLTQEEKIAMCQAVTAAGADFIKTSTGFGTAGATLEDVALMRAHIGDEVKIKAAGGVRSKEDMEAYLKAGADRIGTSSAIAMLEDAPEDGGETQAREDEKTACAVDYGQLVAQAYKAKEMSYAPYSGFHVGAALLGESGKVYFGCNIENAAYSPTNCAERTALFKAVSEGERSFAAIAVAGDGDDFITPCGVCRQALAEFCDIENFTVACAKSKTQYKVLKLKELLPYAFAMEKP